MKTVISIMAAAALLALVLLTAGCAEDERPAAQTTAGTSGTSASDTVDTFDDGFGTEVMFD